MSALGVWLRGAVGFGVVAVFVAAWWLDARPATHPWAHLRRFTLLAQIASLLGAVWALRPGPGTLDDPSAFDAAIGHGTPVLLDIYSQDCGPCLLARPAVDALEQETRGRLRVLRVDTASPAAALVQARYGFRVTPTYVLVDAAGREVWRKRGGGPDRDAIVARLASLSAAPR